MLGSVDTALFRMHAQQPSAYPFVTLNCSAPVAYKDERADALYAFRRHVPHHIAVGAPPGLFPVA
eukprot:3508285-Amphidinium_carterae.1